MASFMKRNSHKLAEEIREPQIILANDIDSREALQLCFLEKETINKRIFTNLFQNISIEELLKRKIFAIN